MADPPDIPTLLAERACSWAAQLRRTPQRPVASGDLRLVIAPAGVAGIDPLLCLVMRRWSEEGWVVVMSAHAAPELACSCDVVFPQGTVTPFPLVVQTDLVATVWDVQVGRKVGQFDRTHRDAVNAAMWDRELPAEAQEVGLYVGAELRGVLDGRWAFKKAEGDDLSRVALGLDDLP